MSGLGISGLGSGIDFSKYIDAIIQADSQKLLNTVGRQEVQAQSEQVVFNNVKSAMGQLESTIKGFKFSQDFRVKTVSSSDSDVFTATAQNSAPNQTFEFTVEALAESELNGQSFESLDSVVHNGADTTITINVRGEDKDISVPSGTTVQELANIIENAGIGVSATAFDTLDGSGHPVRLHIIDDKTGEYEDGPPNISFTAWSSALDNVAAVSDSSDPSISVAGANAEIQVGGTSVFSENNVFSGVIPGVTITVKSADPGVTKSMTIAESTENAQQKIQSLVDAYNQVVAVLRQATFFDPSLEQQTNPTAGDSTLRNVLTRLQSAITSTIPTLPESSQFKSLADLGVESTFDAQNPSANGQLTFDANAFNEALDDNFDDVVNFFEGFTEDSVEYKGFADSLIGVMDSFLGTPNGAITAKLNSLDSELRRLADEKQKQLERIAAKEERLTQKFARLESQLAGLGAQQSALSAALDSVKLNNQAIAKK